MQIMFSGKLGEIFIFLFCPFKLQENNIISHMPDAQLCTTEFEFQMVNFETSH